MDKISGIYKITSPTGAVYIGQSIDIYKRWRNYYNLNCKQQQRIYNSLNKHGVDSHTFEIIEECEKDCLNELEMKWIIHYHVNNFTMLNIVGLGEQSEREISELTKFMKTATNDEKRNYLNKWHDEIHYCNKFKNALNEIHNDGFSDLIIALVNGIRKGLFNVCTLNESVISIEVLNTRYFFNHNLRNKGEIKKWEEIVKMCS
jgi:group I intron endonuclease